MATPVIIRCSSCGAAYQIPPEQLGQQFTCAQCRAVFVATANQPAPVMPGQTMGFQSVGSTNAPRTNGLAITSLVCGLFVCLWPAGVAAIITGIIGLQKTKDGRTGGRGMCITGIVLGSISVLLVPVLLVSILVPALSKARETATRIKCMNNLHQIGLAITLYETENDGQTPPDLATLWQASQLSASDFICPDTKDTPAASPAQLNSGGHCSYIYAVGGMTEKDISSTTVTVYETPSNHKDGSNILFGDGHAEFLNTQAAQQAIAQSQKQLQNPQK